MDNAVRRYQRPDTFMDAGYVVDDGGSLAVVVGDVRSKAERAAACLTAPKPGDHVLVAFVGDACFIISVLESAEAGAHIDVEGDLAIAVRQGKLAITAQRGVEVHTAGDAELTAPRARLRVIDAEAMVDRLRWLGDKLNVDIKHVATVADTVDSFAQRVRSRAERAYRFVADFDQLRAGHIDHRAKGTVRVHGENTVVTANELAKIDGEQIHVG